MSLISVDTKSTASVGGLIHITGTGFNAIEGAEAAAGATGCSSLQNSCSPLRGTCVEIEDPPASNNYRPAEVVAVTPTHLVVKSPIICDKKRKVRITRPTTIPELPASVASLDINGGTFFCRN